MGVKLAANVTSDWHQLTNQRGEFAWQKLTYPQHNLYDASAPSLVTLSMPTCGTIYHGHREGWGPVSSLREFDLTPCFEEGIILPTLLVVLLLISLSSLQGTKSAAANRILTSRSASVLKAKLVCPLVIS